MAACCLLPATSTQSFHLGEVFVIFRWRKTWSGSGRSNASERPAMKDYVLDANAVIRFFKVGNAGGGEKVQELFLQAQRNQARLSMSVINMGEVL